MRQTGIAVAATIAALISVPTTSARSIQPRQLTIEDRVRAQEAIERVHYSHQIGARRPFGEIVTNDLLVRKVREYLRRSAAVETLATGRVTAEALEREMERIARDTRLPDRIEEIYAALGRDPVLVLECFVRPILVERLTRDMTPEDLPDLGAGPIETLVSPQTTLSSPAANSPFSPQACSTDDTWSIGSLAPAPEEGRRWHSAVWTGNLMLAWGGASDSYPTGYVPHGLKYDPVADTWGTITTAGAPAPRRRHVAVWTGTEMIVWGGQDQIGPLGAGGRYNPVTNTWLPVSLAGAPGPRYYHTAVWTGSAMLIWGGTPNTSGHRYHPSTDTWSPISTLSAPPPVQHHTAVWTGSEMLVWGGYTGSTYLDSGGRYNPATDMWGPITRHRAPTSRSEHAAVWTGSEMVIWGGFNNRGLADDGGRYNPITDSWRSTSTVGAPAWSSSSTTVWTGTRMIIYGGECCGGPTARGSGGLYDPVADIWAPMSPIGAPSARSSHSAIWTGSLMVVWGGVGDFGEGDRMTGGRYNPVTNTWLPTSMTSSHPESRRYHSAVWTGNEMLVWGGTGQDQNSMGDGFRYNPMTDTSTAIQIMGAPSPRERHSAVWTGDEMIVWGGLAWDGTAFLYMGDGARYDPISNSWSPIATVIAPTARYLHTAIWSGAEMILWGGVGQGGIPQSNGARYNPSANAWIPVSTANAPSPRYWHTSIWSGNEMIVWGGNDGSTYLDSGGRYNPGTDNWQATQSAGAPSGRGIHTTVWTGQRMIVWGGTDGSQRLQTGGGYDPGTDSWTPTSTTGAPSPRYYHTSVWSGTSMIVWGGGQNPGHLDSGGRYNPYLDTWTQTSSTNTPSARYTQTSVWADGEMIVWGGVDAAGFANTGGRYAVTNTADDDVDGYAVCAGDCDDQDPATYPGAPQICDGKNNDCMAAGWPALTGTNEGDGDGDSVAECQGDCDDANAAAWSTPGEVSDVTLRADGATLDWMTPAAGGGASLSYDTLRSGTVNDFAGAAVCVESDDGADNVSVDTWVPASGEISYYLVRARNVCPGSLGQGSLGAGSNGTPRPGRTCP